MWTAAPTWEPLDGGLQVADRDGVFLRRSTVRLTELGIEATRGRRRWSWPWDRVAALSWDIFRDKHRLAVLVKQDPYPKMLPVGGVSSQVANAALAGAAVFVESHGARVEAREVGATMWWIDDPDAKPGRT